MCRQLNPHLDQEPQVDVLTPWLLPVHLTVLVVPDVDSLKADRRGETHHQYDAMAKLKIVRLFIVHHSNTTIKQPINYHGKC